MKNLDQPTTFFLKPYTISVIPPIDIRRMSLAQAKRVYKKSYRLALLAANFAQSDTNWGVSFDFYLPPGMEVEDLGENLREGEAWQKK